MYTIETAISKIKIEDLIKNYYDRERVEGYCKKCSNYNMIWSCPPYDFNTEEYLRRFENIHIVGTKVIFDESTIKRIKTKEEIYRYSFEATITVRKKVYDELIKLEDEYLGSKIINSGNCSICGKCTRSQNIKCIHEDDIRYSLESLGFDVEKIAKDLLKINLKWPSDKLPEYLTLASGLLTNFDIENSDINKVFNK
jgi:predicted metal-binding protein